MILLWCIKKVPFLWYHAIVYVSSAKLLCEGHQMSEGYDRKGESESHDDSRGSHGRQQRKGKIKKKVSSQELFWTSLAAYGLRLRFWLGASGTRRDGGIFRFSGDAEVGLLESLVCSSQSTSSGKACKHLEELETPHLLKIVQFSAKSNIQGLGQWLARDIVLVSLHKLLLPCDLGN